MRTTEAAIIATILTDPDAIHTALSANITPAHFTTPQLAVAYTAAANCAHRNLATDRLTVAEKMKETGIPTGDATPEEILDYAINEFSADLTGSFETHLALLEDRHKKTTVGKIANELHKVSANPTTTGEEAVATAEKAILALDSTSEPTQTHTTEAALDELLRQMTEGRDTKYLTGFQALDDEEKGIYIKGGQMIIIAARPGTGKSALALQLGATFAANTGETTLFISHEMSAADLTARLIAARLNAPINDIVNGKLLLEQEETLIETFEELSKLPYQFVDPAPDTIEGTVSLIRKKARETKLGCVIVDYIQMISTSDKTSRAEGLGKVAYALKRLARELNIPILVLSQLNRASESRVDPRPKVPDLRESGAIEQAADIILLLHRPWNNDPNTYDPTYAECIIGKHRNGQANNTAILTWKGRSASYHTDPENPKPTPTPQPRKNSNAAGWHDTDVNKYRAGDPFR